MILTIGGKAFKYLIDTGADRNVLRKEEIPRHWRLVPGPPLLGVGGQTSSQETVEWVPWVDPDGNMGEVHPLVAPGLTANLLGQDVLGEAEAYISTDRKALYADLPDEEGYQQQFQGGQRCHPDYRDDPAFEMIRRAQPHSNPRPHPQS